MSLHAYSDADFAGDSEDRKSTGGYVVFLGEGAVSWSSKKQSMVALSSTESEYIALSEAAREILWVRWFLDSINIAFDKPTTIFEDNQSTIAYARNQRAVGRMKHIQVKFHFVCDLIENGKINLVYCHTKFMTADILTKPLSPTTHAAHSERLGICPARLEGEYWRSRALRGSVEGGTDSAGGDRVGNRENGVERAGMQGFGEEEAGQKGDG
jgi:hypothetical protein